MDGINVNLRSRFIQINSAPPPPKTANTQNTYFQTFESHQTQEKDLDPQRFRPHCWM